MIIYFTIPHLLNIGHWFVPAVDIMAGGFSLKSQVEALLPVFSC